MPGRITDEQRSQVIQACRDGAHPQVACVAAGLAASYYSVLQSRANRGDETASAFYSAIQQAVAGAEVADVASTAKAARSDCVAIECPHCSREYVADPADLAALVQANESAQRVRKMQAEVALTRLERRHPKRWSQKVVHTVQEEHERLLDVCQRILAPEVFEALLESYLSEGDGEGEVAGGSSGPTTGDVH